MRALLLFLVAVSAFAEQSAITIENLLSAAFPSGLSAAPAGAKFAWVQNKQGVRNIWVAEPPDYRGRQLTKYDKDDGQDLGAIDWSPDAKVIVYGRGGRANRQDEFPNPTSDPAGQTQALWRVSLDGSDPVKIADGHTAAVSVQGRVAFIQKSAVWSAPLDGSAAAQKLFQARGNPQEITWSPDGSRLAFVSSRGDHNFVGVYDVASKGIQFLDPTVDRDRSPTWSPDGKRIAFIRIGADSQRMSFRPEREAHPWSIVVADVATGEGKTIWRAEPGVGSAYWPVVADEQLIWSAGDLLVFPWERDGWVHLYSVPVSGGKARLLTPGKFEVEYVTHTPDRRFVIYNSNEGDIDRRHLWRLSIADGDREMLTPGRGIEWAPRVASDGRAIAFFRSDARIPAHAAIRLASGEHRDLAANWLPADFPDERLSEPQAVTFAAADGMQIPAQLFLPWNHKPGEKHPAAIFFHGGSRRQMLLGWNYSPYYHNAYAFNQYLASRGYVVLSVNYRSGIGYGMEFREALGYGARGASEFNDVIGAGLYLRNRPDVDPNRIAMWGGSYGGYLTALGLARASHLFAAGVDLHGVHDWNVVIQNFSPDYDPIKRTEDARLAFSSSPLASIETWRSPVLVIHGDDDRNVPFGETVRLVEALRKKGVEVEQRIYPDEVHSFLLHRRWIDAFRTAADFLDRKLK